MEICNGGIFLSKGDIWQDELVRDKGSAAQRLFPMVDLTGEMDSQATILAMLLNIANGGDMRELWAASQTEREETHQKKQGQMALFRQARQAGAGTEGEANSR